jgi:hypothetical protein
MTRNISKILMLGSRSGSQAPLARPAAALGHGSGSGALKLRKSLGCDFVLSHYFHMYSHHLCCCCFTFWVAQRYIFAIVLVRFSHIAFILCENLFCSLSVWIIFTMDVGSLSDFQALDSWPLEHGFQQLRY